MKAELDAIVAVNKKDLKSRKFEVLTSIALNIFFILLYKLNQLTAATAKQCSIFLHQHCQLKT